MNDGRKDDQGKDRWDLVPMGPMRDVVRVLMFGAQRYGDDNWHMVVSKPDGVRRYFSAVQRHLVAWWEGERLDPDSGMPHLAHAICGLLFLSWFDKQIHVEKSADRSHDLCDPALDER